MVVEIILIMMIIAAPSSALNSSVLSLESSSYADPFVLLGVFSVLKDRATRDAIRNSFLRNSAVCNYRTPRGRYRKKQGRQPCISVRFVLGHDYSNEAKDEALRRKEQAENGGDLFVIPIHENMNSGKSPAFLKAVALSGLPETVAFVGKSDTDTFIWPNRIIEELLRLPPPQSGIHFQIGSTIGYHRCGGRRRSFCPTDYLYMAGALYFLSRSVVHEAFTTIDVSEQKFLGHEDFIVGRFIHSKLDIVQIDKLRTSCFAHEEGGKLATAPRRTFAAMNSSSPPKTCRAVEFPLGGAMPLCTSEWPPPNDVCLLRRAPSLRFAVVPERKLLNVGLGKEKRHQQRTGTPNESNMAMNMNNSTQRKTEMDFEGRGEEGTRTENRTREKPPFSSLT